ncbi:ATP:cob(I)alamin adenosyltransferase [Candidatus Roizmanbacteria bacterium RIFCSPHIGHO2_12_FULL_44_10]|uniref:Corrinoid adenosyltransferase n=1 Tax=Candidatus Roizmanbacteria bacterium RIFCSPHIGHO2_12_FULL_44_10 TaxID=1802054 RepID=A0A1F7I591_9BACT|nr:MAG: ATP:cob(I)alamin adenosyltransferase [Candidatus Roizmanbacteria bacterium RIFCSPHIGHO2_12_FULL_44_10]
MAIYTKTGDKGTTALFGGKRVSKNNQQIKAYGVVDELSSVIGVVISKKIDKEDGEFLTTIQKNLYAMMGVLCNAKVSLDSLKSHTEATEDYIDEQEKTLPELRNFILPQGTEESAWFHVIRTVCRRAERSLVGFLTKDNSIEASQKEVMLQYLNRMSDLFFIMARKYNQGKEVLA